MATRGKLRRIEKVMQGHMGAIELVDGSTFYFDPEAVVEEMFAFFSDSLRAVRGPGGFPGGVRRGA